MAPICLYLPSPTALKDSHLRGLQPFATSSGWQRHKASVYIHHRQHPYPRPFFRLWTSTRLPIMSDDDSVGPCVCSSPQADLEHASHSMARCHVETVMQTTPKAYSNSGFGTPSRFIPSDLFSSSPQAPAQPAFGYNQGGTTFYSPPSYGPRSNKQAGFGRDRPLYQRRSRIKSCRLLFLISTD